MEPSSPAPLVCHWCQQFPPLRTNSAPRDQHILFCCILNCWSVLWWLTCCEGCQIQPLPWERAASPGRGNLRRRGLVEQGKESWLLSNVVGSSQLLYDLYGKPQTALIQTFVMWDWNQKLESNSPPSCFTDPAAVSPVQSVNAQCSAPLLVERGSKARTNGLLGLKLSPHVELPVQSSKEPSSGAALPRGAAVYYVGWERGFASWGKLSSRPKAFFCWGCY